MPVILLQIPAVEKRIQARRQQRRELNRRLYRHASLTIGVCATVYGAASLGEAASLIEFLLLPLAGVSICALLLTTLRRVALEFAFISGAASSTSWNFSASPKNRGR